MASNMELQLLLKLNDQMSRGLKAALNSAQKESKALANDVGNIGRAADKIKPTSITRMTEALNKAKSAAKSTMDMLSKTAQLGASVAAGGYVLKAATQKPIAFDKKLAQYANTAYGGSVENRIAGRAKLEAGVNNAVRLGGGSRDDAADTLNSMISSGAMGEGQKGVDSSIKLLPVIQQLSTATGASSQELASIVQSLKQQMKMSDDEVIRALSKSVVAGQMGGFDLNNMAKWLPQQISLAVNNGMTGMKGFETLIAANQASRITAGTPDEAGNNLVNLLAKITSADTANDFKKQNVDLYGSLVKNMSGGMNSLDAFVGMIKKIGEGDKQYQQLKQKAETAQGEEQKALFESMASILMAKGIGKGVQDRQALTALLGMIQQNGVYQRVKKGVQAENGTEIENGFKAVATTTGFKKEQVGTEADIAASNAMSAVSGPLGTLLQGITSVSQANPILAAAAYSAATALGVLAASAGVSALFKSGGGAAAGGILGAAMTKGGGLLAKLFNLAKMPLGGLAMTGSATGAATGLGTIAGGVGLAGLGGYGIGTLLNKQFIDGTELSTKIGETVAKALAAFGDKQAQQALNVNLSLDGKQITAAINSQNTRQASRR